MQHLDEEHVNLSSLADAQVFLSQFHWYRERLEASVGMLRAPMFDGDCLGPQRIRTEVVKHWSDIMSQLPLQQQQDRLFQNTLTVALENVILSQVHDRVCQELYVKYKEEDHEIWSRCQFLTKINLSAEMLEIPEGYGLSFPAAVVELAALDIQKCPLDKLRCLRSTIDYIDAEIKHSIADTHNMASSGKLQQTALQQMATSGNNFKSPFLKKLEIDEAAIFPITSEHMVSLLTAVLIQAKPLHLATNLNYMESYQQTLSPCDPLCTSLENFQKALSHLLNINVEEEEEIKPVRLGRGMSKEIELEELAQLACYMGKGQTGSNSDANQVTITPLECQLHQLAGKIEKAMDDDVNKTEMETLLNNCEINIENDVM